MSASLFLLASLVAFNDERKPPPAAPNEQCVEIRQFRANGGCRVAVDRNVAWMCVTKSGEKYDVRFKSEEGTLVKHYAYDQRRQESWGGHVEIFYTSSDSKTNPDLKIGLADARDSQIVVGKGRYCLPADAAKTFKQ
jgi:hypothetical protein